MPRKRNPEAARIEADYKSKQKRTGRTASDTIKSRLKSGKSKPSLAKSKVVPERGKVHTASKPKTKFGGDQTKMAYAKAASKPGTRAYFGSKVGKDERIESTELPSASSSAPEGNRAVKGKKTATARKKAKKPARAKRASGSWGTGKEKRASKFSKGKPGAKGQAVGTDAKGGRKYRDPISKEESAS